MEGLVVVTGANGHIGSNLCRQLLEEGYSVRGTVRSLDKSPDLEMEFVEADVLVEDGWDSVLEGAVDYSTSLQFMLQVEMDNLFSTLQIRVQKTYSGLLPKQEFLELYTRHLLQQSVPVRKV